MAKPKAIYRAVVSIQQGLSIARDQLDCGHTYQCRISAWRAAKRRRCHRCEVEAEERQKEGA